MQHYLQMIIDEANKGCKMHWQQLHDVTQSAHWRHFVAELSAVAHCVASGKAAVTHTATVAEAGITKTTIRMNSVNDAFCDWQMESGRGIEKGWGKKEE